MERVQSVSASFLQGILSILESNAIKVNYSSELRVDHDIYMLFAGWEVRMVKNCNRGLENTARGRRQRAAFSRPRSQFFTIRTDT